MSLTGDFMKTPGCLDRLFGGNIDLYQCDTKGTGAMSEPGENQHKPTVVKWDYTVNVSNILAIMGGIVTILAAIWVYNNGLNEKFSDEKLKFSEFNTKISEVNQKIDQLVYRLGMSEQAVNALRLDQRTTDNEIKDGLRDLNKEVVNLRINGGGPNRVRP